MGKKDREVVTYVDFGKRGREGQLFDGSATDKPRISKRLRKTIVGSVVSGVLIFSADKVMVRRANCEPIKKTDPAAERAARFDWLCTYLNNQPLRLIFGGDANAFSKKR